MIGEGRADFRLLNALDGLHPMAPAWQLPYPIERSSLQLYLQEIAKTPLLTIAEEVTLARRIRRGDQAARDHMIKANLRLVVI